MASRLFTGFRTLTESPTVADSVDRVFAGARGVSEDLSSLISDLVDHSMNTAAFLSEVVAPSDLASRVFNAFRTTSESPAISDAVARVFGGFRALAETQTVSDVASRAFGGFRGLTESLAGMTDSISKSAGKFLSEDISATLSDALSRMHKGTLNLADASPFSESASRFVQSTRDVLDNFPFNSVMSRIASLARGVTDSFPFSDSVPLSKSLISSFQVLVTDSYAYSETGARTAGKAIIDYFAFGDQIGSGGSINTPGFFTDLANRVFAGFNWLTGSPNGSANGSPSGSPNGSPSGSPTGSPTATSPVVLGFGTIGALAAAIAIFVGRRKASSGCNVITMAAPLCPRLGMTHKCATRAGHAGTHRCRCGASW